ncbi:MAG: dihydroneopterin aldolase [Bacteroidales bacterium]|nr:dihydroneopterin aldolase [Bacteroidales bacterium]
MKGRIELTGMHFRAFHGCLESERTEGGDFKVDFSCEADTSRAERSDDLADTLDYSAVYAVVAAQMQVPSQLLEAVAGRIADAIGEEFPSIGHFEVSVYKKNPPVGGECEWAKVTVRR